ncbi:Txe/YoeB family addiction module toxin [Buttiauxella sp. S04-F03]|uniref:Txe/YoeB family addiction module toxin n=1 Tax=Buttiauxella sp. S04-F03 TaxID=2904525 RepID=UPI001E2CF3F3|nr:Txe/YoeB family addiction module toxin [Buttiauxella sp. S04-F03]MCE0814752.1 Txe/YoeB family addiction module toxin [Buttiauxella sp. S04-F03]
MKTANRLLAWTDHAWEDYLWWQTQDKKTLKRINKLIEDAQRNPFDGLGKPEPLRENLSGLWSRRTNDADRLVYSVSGDLLTIFQCRLHY